MEGLAELSAHLEAALGRHAAGGERARGRAKGLEAEAAVVRVRGLVLNFLHAHGRVRAVGALEPRGRGSCDEPRRRGNAPATWGGACAWRTFSRQSAANLANPATEVGWLAQAASIGVVAARRAGGRDSCWREVGRNMGGRRSGRWLRSTHAESRLEDEELMLAGIEVRLDDVELAGVAGIEARILPLAVGGAGSLVGGGRETWRRVWRLVDDPTGDSAIAGRSGSSSPGVTWRGRK